MLAGFEKCVQMPSDGWSTQILEARETALLCEGGAEEVRGAKMWLLLEQDRSRTRVCAHLMLS